MELWHIFAAIGVFVGGAAVYLAFMIFLPEWVGITGEKALEAERSHRGDLRGDEDVGSETAPKSDAETDASQT